MSKEHNTVTCSHGKGLACPVCYDQSFALDSLSQHPDVLAESSDLSVCGEACNCMKCNPSKSSCIALRAAELNLPCVDVSTTENVEPMPFSELSDGAYFMCVGPHTSTRVFQKVMEDGEHNAVWTDHTHIGELVPHSMPVIRVHK